jgi:hypothetical protein
MENLRFYEYCQNNSGGIFDIDDFLTVRVVVEATSQEDAIKKGESMGIYFDGCEKEMDCPCCGDRWYEPELVDLRYGGFFLSEAEEISYYYRGEITPSRFPKRRGDKEDRKDFVFADVEELFQYIADKWGNSHLRGTRSGRRPEVRIFYLDGTVKEIYKNEKK